MAPFASVVFLLCLAMSAVSAPAPMKRQTGDLQCNLARLATINDVASAQAIITQMQNSNATADDFPTSAALAVAQLGLTTANNAFQTILDAVLQNEQAPAAARDAVNSGLDAALTALQSASKTFKDASLNATISAATAKVFKAGTDGNAVVADCK
ncbi:hypothetical protein C8F01DRAFT_761116 [Mycena amicta]|nr:hypothetical protein C8F01DRAFT_761116 [Mycena amicta]